MGGVGAVLMKDIDWKRVAAKRLKDIKSLQYQADSLKIHMEEMLLRNLNAWVHIKLFLTDNEGMKEIAKRVAEQCVPKL